MTRLTRREVGVAEVQVANERTVVERDTIGRAPAAADQRRQRRATELLDLRSNHRYRSGVQRPERDPERIQHPQLELPARRLGDVLPPRVAHKPCEPLDLGRLATPHAFARTRACWLSNSRHQCARRATEPWTLAAAAGACPSTGTCCGRRWRGPFAVTGGMSVSSPHRGALSDANESGIVAIERAYFPSGIT